MFVELISQKEIRVKYVCFLSVELMSKKTHLASCSVNENRQQTGYPENPLGTTDMQKLVSAQILFNLSQVRRQQRINPTRLEGNPYF